MGAGQLPKEGRGGRGEKRGERGEERKMRREKKSFIPDDIYDILVWNK